LTLRDEARSCEIRKALNVNPFLLRIKKSQLQWFGQNALEKVGEASSNDYIHIKVVQMTTKDQVA